MRIFDTRLNTFSSPTQQSQSTGDKIFFIKICVMSESDIHY
jgi:hypothetical protein